MNEPKVQQDRKVVMLENVRKNARAQATAECRENYFRSCEAHGGEMVEIVAQVKKELSSK